MTLGSLFDGIGGWQLAAVRAGIKPLWSSEIDKFCMSVTRRHFPDTVQLGDINGIDDAPHVDIVTAGSPCVDLSIAGKQGGIHCERSGLFFRAVELVRRIRTEFFVWENVPNALSIHGGKDFATVLEEITASDIPIPECGFANAGVVDFLGGELAWRILDARYWGVPQRRRRIFLVADFAGRRAAEILFEPVGMSRNTPPRERSQHETAARTRSRFDCARKWFSATRKYSQGWTLDFNHNECLNVYRASIVGSIAFGIGRDAFNQGRNAIGVCYGVSTTSNSGYRKKCSLPLAVKHEACVAVTASVATPSIIRRLTPLECERLQGLPDNWTQSGSDAKRYKALGNGMAQPCADFILRRIKEVTQ